MTDRRSARHTRRGVVTTALATLVLAACSGGEDETATSSAPPPPTAKDRLEQAHDVLVTAGSVHLALAGTNLPEDQSTYIISATGDGTMTPAAFTGSITAKVSGVQADVPTVAKGGQLWVKLPYVPRHMKMTPDELGVPDPATLFDAQKGLVSLLPQTQDPTFGDRTRAGAEIVQQVKGTLPGKAVTDLLYVGDAASPFQVTYGLVEESWQVRTVTITGPFYPPATSTYTVTLTEYGKPVTVAEP